MRAWRLSLVSIALSVAALAQTAQFSDSTQVVHRALAQLSLGMYDAQTEQQLHCLGDAAAVAFVAELGGKAPSSSDIENFLLLVHEAFLTPEAIEIVSDREPRTTRAVLEQFERLTLAPELKRSIVDTKVFLDRHASSSGLDAQPAKLRARS